MNYNELLEKYGGLGLERQASLGDIIGDNNWSADMVKGTLSFGDDIEFPIQVIGTYAFDSETWLWAWANTESGLSDELLNDVKKLHAYGKENDIEFLTSAEFEADQTNVHAIGIIASGLLGASAYYCGNYGEGIILYTIKSEKIDNVPFDEQLRIQTTLSDLINIFTLNHRRAFESYLLAKQYDLIEEGAVITAKKNDKVIQASFDDLDRLTNLKGEIKQ